MSCEGFTFGFCSMGLHVTGLRLQGKGVGLSGFAAHQRRLSWSWVGSSGVAAQPRSTFRSHLLDSVRGQGI